MHWSAATQGFRKMAKRSRSIGSAWQDALLKGALSPYPYMKPLIQEAAGVGDPPLGSTPHEVVMTQGPIRLLYYPPKERRQAPPILFVYSLINRFYILDFLPGRSLIEYMRDAGFDVYAIDWGTPGDAQSKMTWDECVNEHIDAAVHRALRRSDAEALHLYGYCMGGTLALTYAALHPEKLQSFVAQATPVNFHDRGIFHQWTKPQHFDVDALVDAYGNVPIPLMEGAFSMMAPIQRMTKWLEVFRRIDDPAFVSTFLAMEEWASDNIPFPGEVYRQYIKDCYQTNRLFKGEMKVGGRRIDLSSIRCPLLTIVAEYDTIAPPVSSEALQEVVSSKDKALFRFKAGHIGLTTSSKGRKIFWPKIAEWLADR